MRPRLDGKTWHEVLASKHKAKQVMNGLQFISESGTISEVTFVVMSDGKKVAPENVTPDEAYDFLVSMCPKWVFI